MTHLILASGSPRRHELLARLLTGFAILTSPVEEAGSTLMPEWHAEPVELPPPYLIREEHDPRLWAWRKAMDVFSTNTIPANTLILGADTVVVGPAELLGKPKDTAHAQAILQTLRGIEHYVVTGFVLLRARGNHTAETIQQGATITRVVMGDYSDADIEAYIVTGEPMDKAGAYALQGLGGKLVERVEGCRTNVVGLPLCAIRRALEAGGAELLAVPEGGYCGYCPIEELLRQKSSAQSRSV
ncbi:MAG TPA: Maf family protein [Chloroflexia bacterium]|nr:Maf family protein [Chloroflexia bacterium]